MLFVIFYYLIFLKTEPSFNVLSNRVIADTLGVGGSSERVGGRTKEEVNSSDVYERVQQLAANMKKDFVATRQMPNQGEGTTRGALEETESTVSRDQERDGGVHGVSGRGRRRAGLDSSEADSEMAAKLRRALAKMKHLDSRLAELAKV